MIPLPLLLSQIIHILAPSFHLVFLLTKLIFTKGILALIGLTQELPTQHDGILPVEELPNDHVLPATMFLMASFFTLPILLTKIGQHSILSLI